MIFSAREAFLSCFFAEKCTREQHLLIIKHMDGWFLRIVYVLLQLGQQIGQVLLVKDGL